MNKSRIFLTGATGFIGSHLTKQFIQQGYEVTALIREKSSTEFIDYYINRKQIDIQIGDITKKEGLAKLMQGCEILVHNASFVGDWGKKETYYKTNVDGTKNVLEAAKNNKINFIMLTSTIAVLGEEDCLEKKTEDFPYNPDMPYFLERFFPSDMNYYRHTKMLAEKESIKFCKENKIDLTIVRPVWTYGPREFHAGPYIFCKSISEGNRFFPGSKKNLFHTIYVEDLAKIMTKLLNKKPSGINIFNVGSEKVQTMNTFWSMFCDALGKKDPIYLPKFLVYPVGLLMEASSKIFKSKEAPLLTRARVEMGYCNNISDTQEIKKEIGFFHETPLKESIEKTIRWWKINGYL